MRQATLLVLIMTTVGCIADDDVSAVGGEDAESTAAPTHDPTSDNCPGGSGGPGGQPERKRCLPSNPDTLCLDCCLYNYNHVDGWKCRRIKDPEKKEACWARAADTLGKCQREDCDRYGPITTLQVFDDLDR